jgi:GT2 family glycosyltransferase
MSEPTIPVLGIPHYNRPDLTLRCLESVDVDVGVVALVCNAPRGGRAALSAALLALKKRRHPLADRVEVVAHPNAGVAASWNEIVKLFPAPWWLISNNDIRFAPGDLAQMAAHVRADPGLALAHGNHRFAWFAVTRGGVEQVGLWDENLYPAYLEDCDWEYRARLCGARLVGVEGLGAQHGEGEMTHSCTIRSDAHLLRENERTHRANFVYYERKWGGRNGTERFRTPFDDPRLPVWAWRFEPAMRAAQQWAPAPAPR